MFEEDQGKNLYLFSEDENEETDQNDFTNVVTPGEENQEDEKENPSVDEPASFELESEEDVVPLSDIEEEEIPEETSDNSSWNYNNTADESENSADEILEDAKEDSLIGEDKNDIEPTPLSSDESDEEDPPYAKASPFVESSEDNTEDEELPEEPESESKEIEESGDEALPYSNPSYTEESQFVEALEDESEEEEVEEVPEEPAPQKVTAGQAEVIKSILKRIADEIEQIKKILPGEVEISGELSISPDADTDENEDGSIVEGVFDGEGMVGSNGKQYDVPANYASKSKLVEGDILKLTITPNGSFLFKQIGPSERNRIVGTLAYDAVQGRYLVTSENKKWYILTASVTYFKGKPGDETVILVPKSAPSRWAAVENIISKKEVRISY